MSEPHREMERHNRVPRGFLVVFFALIAWALWYIAAYTPQISGWSQYKVLKADLEAERKRAAASPPARENPYEKDPKAIAEGQLLFREHCAGCHGPELKGEVGPDLTVRLKYGETDDALFASVNGGRPDGMPAFGTQLGRERIWKVLAYVDGVRERGTKP